MEDRRVRIAAESKGVATVLEVETRRRRSALESVRRVLYSLGVLIVHVESTVRGEGLLERFHVVEADGTALPPRRLAALRATVRRALRDGASGVAAA